MQYLIMLHAPVHFKSLPLGTAGVSVHPIVITAESESDARTTADKIAGAMNGSKIISVTALDGAIPKSVAAIPATSRRRTEIAVFAMVIAGVMSSVLLQNVEPAWRGGLSGAIAVLALGVTMLLQSLPRSRTA